MKPGIIYCSVSRQKSNYKIYRITKKIGKPRKKGETVQHHKIILGIVAILSILISGHSTTFTKLVVTYYNLATIEVKRSLITAASGSRDDIQTAVDQAIAGDIVQIPAGTFDFNGTVIVKEGIHIRGEGRDNTVLTKAGTERYMFRFKVLSNDSPAFSAIKLVDPEGPYAVYDINKASIGVEMAYGCCDFRVFDCEFEGFGCAGVITREYWGSSSSVTWWKTRGVIYNSRFIDCYMPGLGYGANVQGGRDKAWDEPLDLGSDWATFIEDNYFSGCRHAIASGDGARYVCRYNLIENNRRSHAIYAHGPLLSSRGTRKYEIYENVVKESADYPDGVCIRGGDGVIFNNTFDISAWPIILTHDNLSLCKGWPCQDQIRELYIWGNSCNSNPVTRNNILLEKKDIEVILRENRDFFMYKKPGYTPYTYPHPLRTNEPFISISTFSLEFNATIAGDNPPNQTFQISNSGGGADDWSITDDADWLSVNPTSGSSTGKAIEHTVSVNIGGLSAGTYFGKISIADPNAANNPQLVKVTLELTSIP